MKKKITALLLTLIMLLSLCPVMAEQEDYATRLYTAEQFIYAIGINNLKNADEFTAKFSDWESIDDADKETLKLAAANQILNGYEDGSIRPYDKVLRIEAFVMLSRALKQPDMQTPPIVFSDTPKWAESDINRLSAAGLIKGVGEGVLGADDYITCEQVLILAERIDSIYTKTDLKDDYYEHANAKWLRNNSVPQGYIAWSTSAETQQRTEKAIKEIILGYANEPEGSARKNVYNYYLSVLDTKKRNADGAEPVNPYLEMLEAARTSSDIIEVMANIAKDNFMFSLLPINISPDELNTDNTLITLSSADTGMSAYHLIEDKEALGAYRKYLSELFTLAGDDARLGERIDAVINLDKALAASALNYYEYQEFENRYNEYTPEKFRSEFPNIDLALYFNTMGVPIPNRFIVEEVQQMNTINSVISDNTVELLKDYIKAVLLCDSASFLSDGFLEANRTFNSTFFTVDGDTSQEEYAVNATDDVWGAVIGADYLEKYYSESVTTAISDITHELTETYKERINNLDWLSDNTKKSAVKKLDALRVKIGGPDGYHEFYNNAVILSPEQGGSLFNNTSRISALSFEYGIDILKNGYDKDSWNTTPHTVNAYYSPLNNEIVLPAGILQEPFYSPDYSYEQNLGAIGSIIAHELSHAFDSTGAQYDEKGNFKDWWTKQDYQKFEELSKKVSERYSNIEILKGKFVNGDYTLNENIADLGAMSCILETAKKHKDFNYDKMLRSYANSWAEIIPDKNLATMLYVDEHAPSKVRVNGVLQNFEEFYTTYGIEKNDKMYLDPNERVFIW